MTAALSVVSFVLAAIAYWRSGGKQDARKLRQEVEVLRAKQRELIETASRAVADACERSRKRLNATRDRLRAMKEGAREGLARLVSRLPTPAEFLAAQCAAVAPEPVARSA